MKHLNNWLKFNEGIGSDILDIISPSRAEDKKWREEAKSLQESDPIYRKIRDAMSSIISSSGRYRSMVTGGRGFRRDDSDYTAYSFTSALDGDLRFKSEFFVFDDDTIIVKLTRKYLHNKTSKAESIKVKTIDGAIKLTIDEYKSYNKEVEDSTRKREADYSNDLRKYDREIDESRKIRY